MATTYKPKLKHYTFEEKKLVLDAFFAELERGSDVSLRQYSEICGINYWTLRDWMAKIGGDSARLDELRRAPRPRKPPLDVTGLSEHAREAILELKGREPSWGPLKIKQYLFRHEQMLVPQTSIYRFLKANGLVTERRAEAAGESHGRRFEYPHPLAAVQMDLLTVSLCGGRNIFLVTLLDDFSRFVLTSRFIPVKTMKEVTGVFTESVRRYGVMDKLLTDCGAEFVSWQRFTAFEELLVDLDVEYIASGPDKKENQGKIERWHQTVRQALREHGPLVYGSEAQLWIRGVVDLYNYERPHQAIGGLVPADRFFGVHEEIEAELERYRAGIRVGQRIYLACRVGGRRLVLSGPSGDDLSLHLDGACLTGHADRRCAKSGVMPLPDQDSAVKVTLGELSGRNDRQLEEKTQAPHAEPKEQADAGYDNG
jgi:putative transposase